MSKDHPLYVELPTRDQIRDLTSLHVINDLRAHIERQIVIMETKLEFDQGVDLDWQRRASNALAFHRYTDRLLARRHGELRGAKSKAGPTPRDKDDNHPLTNEAMDGVWKFSASEIGSVEEIDRAISYIAERIMAVEEDRNDEISMPAKDRDEGFMATTGSLLRRLRGQRQELHIRRGALTREAKAKARTVDEGSREQLFIDAAREILPRETFLAIWTQVDRLEA